MWPSPETMLALTGPPSLAAAFIAFLYFVLR